MSNLTRFGVSIESNLVDAFDKLSKIKGFANRSDALRQCMRNALQQEASQDPHTTVSGVLSVIYDHHNSDLPKKLTAMQHEVHEIVMTSIHIHLDLHHCLEVMILKGQNDKVQDLANKLSTVRGVLQANLAITCIESLTSTAIDHTDLKYSSIEHNHHNKTHKHKK